MSVCDNKVFIMEQKHTPSYYPEVVHDQEVLNSMSYFHLYHQPKTKKLSQNSVLLVMEK